MAIGFRAASALVGIDTGTSLALTAPAGTTATDILIACIEFDGGTNITITPPSGWTLCNRTNSTTTSGTATYWALGSVSSLTFTLTSTTAIGWVLGYTGVNNTTPMDVTAVGQANASSVTGTAPAITTVTNNAWVVNVFGFNSIGATFSGQTFTNDRQNGHTTPTTSDPQSMDSGDSIQASAGTFSSKTTTSSVAGVNQGIAVALRPSIPPVDEDFWVPVLVLPPYSDSRPSQLRFLVSGAGTKAAAFVPDEDYWQGPRPAVFAVPVVFTDDDVWVPPPITFVPDEDYWFAPPPIVLPVPQAITDDEVIEILQAAEDYWLVLPKSPVFPVPIVFTDDDVIEILQAAEEYWLRLPQQPVVPAPIVFTDDEIWVPQPVTFVPDEDYWLVVTPPVALSTPKVFSDDEVIEILQAAEDYWLVLPTQPVYTIPLVFKDDELWIQPPVITFVPDEDYWQVYIPAVPTIFQPLPWPGSSVDDDSLVPFVPPPVVVFEWLISMSRHRGYR